MKPLVSIIIPCYNAAPWLAETLKSTLVQTWKNIEIIIVDDGSKDNSLSVAKSFESSQVKVISQINQGASVARNAALKEAQGDFIQYLDADDLLAPDKIEIQLNILNFDYNSHHIASAEWARFYKNPSEALFIPQALWRDMSPVEWLVCAWENNLMMHPAAWLVPRCIANHVGAWNEKLSLNDDGEYFCRVVLASKGVKFCSGAKSYYRSGVSGTLSGKTSKYAWESALQSTLLCSNYLLSVEDSLRTRHACATLLQRSAHTIYPDFPELVEIAEAKVNSLGGSELQLDGNPLLKFIEHTLGWKAARRIQKFKQQYLLY